jgi:hypothetical protein
MDKSTTCASKIVEFEDEGNLSDELIVDSDNEEDEIPMMFKQSVLKNKRCLCQI